MRSTPATLMAAAIAVLVSACASSTPTDAPAADRPATRTISHEYGQAEVPADPQRVVVLDARLILPTAVVLDVPVVGYQDQPFGDRTTLPFVDEGALADAQGVGFNTISIEAVAALEPDLIIGNDGQIDEDLYPQFQQIAPTVALEAFIQTPWRDVLRTVADAFNRADEVEQGIADYEARAAEVREAVGDAQGTEVTLANLRALDDIRVIPSANCSSAVLEDVGFVRPPGQQGEERTDLSIERLGEIDADILFYYVGSSGTDPAEAAQAQQAITANPLWGTLGAVQRDRAYEVDQAHWFSCGSLQAQNLVLDDVERLMLGEA